MSVAVVVEGAGANISSSGPKNDSRSEPRPGHLQISSHDNTSEAIKANASEEIYKPSIRLYFGEWSPFDNRITVLRDRTLIYVHRRLTDQHIGSCINNQQSTQRHLRKS